jgi:sodium transport system permease protein
VFAIGGLVACTLLTIGLFRLVPRHEFGSRFPAVLGWSTAGRMLALYVPLAPLLSAAALWMATFSKSYKEAQSLLAILMPVPAVPFIISAVVPLSHRPWLAPIPIVGQFALAADILSGSSPAWHWYLLAAATAVAGAALLVAGVARLLRRESILFAST